MCQGPDSEAAWLIVTQNKIEKERSVPLEKIAQCLRQKRRVLSLAKLFPFEANALKLLDAVLRASRYRGEVHFVPPPQVFGRRDKWGKPRGSVAVVKLSKNELLKK
jgi:hypothetical protein